MMKTATRIKADARFYKRRGYGLGLITLGMDQRTIQIFVREWERYQPHKKRGLGAHG